MKIVPSITPNIGHDEIDRQHAEIGRLMNRAAMCCGDSVNCAQCTPEQQAICRREVMTLTRELLKFMTGHFRYEEQLMRRLPDNETCRRHVAGHKRAHADISERVSKLINTLTTADPYIVAAELRRIMMEWTGTHTEGLDARMVRLHQQTGHHELDEDIELASLLTQHDLTLREISNDR